MESGITLNFHRPVYTQYMRNVAFKSFQSDLKQNGTQEKPTFSGSICHTLLRGVWFILS